MSAMPELACVGWRESRGADLSGLGSVILPIVVAHDQGTIDITQFERWIGQTSLVGNGFGARLGPIPLTIMLSMPPPLSFKRKPAIRISSPVSTNARVLRLASFESASAFRS